MLVTVQSKEAAAVLGAPIGATVVASPEQVQAIAAAKAAAKTTTTRDLGTMVLYHITSRESAERILASGQMLPGSQGAYGAGIYFCNNAKACLGKAHQRGYLITARVRMGTAAVVTQSGNRTLSRLKAESCDSVFAPKGPRGGAAEYVVYASEQVDVLDATPYTG